MGEEGEGGGGGEEAPAVGSDVERGVLLVCGELTRAGLRVGQRLVDFFSGGGRGVLVGARSFGVALGLCLLTLGDICIRVLGRVILSPRQRNWNWRGLDRARARR